MSLSICKTNQCPLKLLGINDSVCTNEDVLEFLGQHVRPSSITYLNFDSFKNFYVVLLSDIESVCALVGKRLTYSDHKIDIFPLLDCYIIKNVYPDITKEDIIQIFQDFGSVYDVKEYNVLPNSTKFSHVKSGNREISFMLPGCEHGITMPKTVLCTPYSFHVVKYCPACTTEGHSMLECPDIDESISEQKVLLNDEESDIEVDICNDDFLSDDDADDKCKAQSELIPKLES